MHIKLRQLINKRIPTHITYVHGTWYMVHELSFVVACSAGVFWACECTFSYLATVLDLVTVEDWGEETFAKGVGVK